MAKADGSVVMQVNMDVSDADKELARLKQKITRLQEAASVKGYKRDALTEQLAQMKAEYAELQKLNTMDAKGNFVNPKLEEYTALGSKIREAEVEIAQMDRAIAKTNLDLQAEQTYYGDVAVKAVRAMDAAREQALATARAKGALEGQANAAVEAAAGESEAASAADRLADVVGLAEKKMEKFANRVKSLAKHVFVFSLISSALRGMKDWFGKVIKTNSEATAAIAKLKGALLTLVQPLVEVVIPAFTTFVNLLTRVVSTVASLMAKLFGTTVEAAAESAQSLYEEQEALDGVGGSAKDAGKSLAGFDEINTISDGSEGSGAAAGSTGIKPDFGFLSEADARLDKIAKSVLLIAAGLGLWKIASGLPGMLGTVATKLAGIAIAVGGLLLLWDGLKDAWENGIDWPNMIEMFAGAAAVVGGLALAFGKVGGGIGLIVSGAAAVITAFHDICENGSNMENVLLAIAGIVATGLGFSLLTGSALPLFIAGIAAVVVEMLALTGHLEEFASNLKENILGGIIQFIKGVFAGDLEGALEGLKKTVKGVVNGVLIIVESFVNLIIKGLNWLIGKINTIKFDVPDWVPLIGGKRLGFNIKTIGNLTLPRLAQGTVVPPNREFLAVLGDNKQETEVVSPVSTIKQAVLDALRESGGSGQTMEVKLYLDGKQIARNQVKHINDMTQAAGKPVLLF